MLMGVLTLQSCYQYRILVSEQTDYTLYTPEKRVGLGWSEFSLHTGIGYDAAISTIEEHKKSKIVKTKYLYIKK